MVAQARLPPWFCAERKSTVNELMASTMYIESYGPVIVGLLLLQLKELLLQHEVLADATIL